MSAIITFCVWHEMEYQILHTRSKWKKNQNQIVQSCRWAIAVYSVHGPQNSRFRIFYSFFFSYWRERLCALYHASNNRHCGSARAIRFQFFVSIVRSVLHVHYHFAVQITGSIITLNSLFSVQDHWAIAAIAEIIWHDEKITRTLARASYTAVQTRTHTYTSHHK